MRDEEIGFGLIGFGAWGKHHAEAIIKTRGAGLVAIAAKTETTCRIAKEAFPNAAVYSDYHEMLKRNDVDAVSVVVPSSLHHAIGKAVMEAGKHLLLEKPMGLTLEQCDDLLAVASKNDRLIAIGHELRLSSLWGKVKDMIDDGYVGEPQYVLVELSRMPYRHGSDGWRYNIEQVGNWILEEPIHFFDFARWYLQGVGEPQSVYATANSRRRDRPELQDNFSAIVKFEGGVYAVVSQTLASFEHHQTVKVAGTKGSLWAGWSGSMDRTRHPTFFLKASNGDEVEAITIDKITGEIYELEDEMAMMVGAVRDGEPLSVTGEDGRWSCLMCLAAQKSVETGRPVEITELTQEI